MSQLRKSSRAPSQISFRTTNLFTGRRDGPTARIVPLPFANVSNGVIIGLLTAGSGFAAGNFNGAKTSAFHLALESRTVRCPSSFLLKYILLIRNGDELAAFRLPVTER
jgi:hypothetical protein